MLGGAVVPGELRVGEQLGRGEPEEVTSDGYIQKGELKSPLGRRALPLVKGQAIRTRWRPQFCSPSATTCEPEGDTRGRMLDRDTEQSSFVSALNLDTADNDVGSVGGHHRTARSQCLARRPGHAPTQRASPRPDVTERENGPLGVLKPAAPKADRGVGKVQLNEGIGWRGQPGCLENRMTETGLGNEEEHCEDPAEPHSAFARSWWLGVRHAIGERRGCVELRVSRAHVRRSLTRRTLPAHLPSLSRRHTSIQRVTPAIAFRPGFPFERSHLVKGSGCHHLRVPARSFSLVTSDDVRCRRPGRGARPPSTALEFKPLSVSRPALATTTSWPMSTCQKSATNR